MTAYTSEIKAVGRAVQTIHDPLEEAVFYL